MKLAKHQSTWLRRREVMSEGVTPARDPGLRLLTTLGMLRLRAANKKLCPGPAPCCSECLRQASILQNLVRRVSGRDRHRRGEWLARIGAGPDLVITEALPE
jgi:hypothetical protein